MANNRYQQREAKTPPHVSIGDLRVALGMTIDEACAQYHEMTGANLTRGALSGIENGHRGASAQVLTGLSRTYGLRDGSITTNYEPKAWAA